MSKRKYETRALTEIYGGSCQTLINKKACIFHLCISVLKNTIQCLLLTYMNNENKEDIVSVAYTFF